MRPPDQPGCIARLIQPRYVASGVRAYVSHVGLWRNSVNSGIYLVIMDLLDRLAETHIEAAAERGEFDDLPGAGKPMPDDEARHVPAHLRAGYRLLKNAGYVPAEIETQRELRQVEDLLAQATTGSDTAQRLTRRLRWLETRLSESDRGRALLRDRDYAEQIRDRLAHKADSGRNM